MNTQGSPLLGVSFVGKVLNAFVTVRGYKTVSNFMSHEVSRGPLQTQPP